MKLTDEQIDKIALPFIDSLGGDCWNPGDEGISERDINRFARAIEVACKQKWQPMDTAPKDRPINLLLKNKAITVGDDWDGEGWWVDSGDTFLTACQFIGWSELPEVE